MTARAITCYSCGLRVGPGHVVEHVDHLVPVGQHRICPDCKRYLSKYGYLYLGDKRVLHTDGSTKYVSKRELSRLLGLDEQRDVIGEYISVPDLAEAR